MHCVLAINIPILHFLELKIRVCEMYVKYEKALFRVAKKSIGLLIVNQLFSILIFYIKTRKITFSPTSFIE